MDKDTNYRIEHDSPGQVNVPSRALYGAQTQRAIDNFKLSDLRFSRRFVGALGMIKMVAAQVNHDCGLLSDDVSSAIVEAAKEVRDGRHDDQFPVVVFQTGSGTSTNMNANEVIGRLASDRLGRSVHPNDEVNLSQSSNDVFPTAIHVAASLAIDEELLPSINRLDRIIGERAAELKEVVKTGRTHLMDAMPVTFGQELNGWAASVRRCGEQIHQSLPRLYRLAQGGTAVGTGINAPDDFGEKFARQMSAETGTRFVTSDSYFSSLASPGAAVEMSGQLRALAIELTKICNDLRWMNSGPFAGLGEIEVPALQPGSSIMPGKVNPVIPEAVAMACAQVMGNDTAIGLAGQSGNFQLNVMLPLIAYNLVWNIEVLSECCRSLGDRVISGFSVNFAKIEGTLDRNPILITALNSRLGYEKGAQLAKRAVNEGKSILDVVLEATDLEPEEAKRLLDPRNLTGSAEKR